MTSDSGTAPAGWYDDPSQAGRQRYWDGLAWTTATREGGPDLLPPAAPERALSRGLTGTLQGFLWAAGAMYAIAALSWLGYRAVWGDWASTGSLTASRELVDADEAAAGMLGFATMLYVVAAILFLVWYYQAYAAADSRRPEGTRWSAGWAVGGWFIPFANLVIPRLVINEVERMASPEIGPPPIESRWQQVRLSPLGHWWWATFIGWLVVFNTGGYLVRGSALADDAYGTGLVVSAIGLGFIAVSGVLGALYVKRIGRSLYPSSQP